MTRYMPNTDLMGRFVSMLEVQDGEYVKHAEVTALLGPLLQQIISRPHSAACWAEVTTSGKCDCGYQRAKDLLAQLDGTDCSTWQASEPVREPGEHEEGHE